MKKILALVLTLVTIFSTLAINTVSVSAASKNPWDYSPTPTRAVYYTLPTMKGNDVKWIQQALNTTINAGLDIDGSYGPACKAATVKFQKKYGLAQDGSFGPATRAKMVSVLNGLGYYPPSTPASGTYKLCWPVSTSASGYKWITSSLGARSAPVAGASVNHKGIDIGVPTGSSILATADGVVRLVGYNSARGNYVVVYHPSLGLTSIYQHLSSYSVKVGQNVTKGQVIAKSGYTGNCSGPHLHFELVLTSSAPTTVDCAWISGAKLLDGHYDNKLISYEYRR